MFINTLLDIDYNYVIYSDEGNVEYTTISSIFFNPYNTNYEFNENNDVLYKSYTSSFNGIILYITNYIYLPNIYTEYDVIKDNNLITFVNNLFKDTIDFNINYTYEKENFYLINISNSEILTILKKFNYNNYSITYLMKDFYNYYVQGNDIKIYDFEKLFFSKSETLLIISYNDKIIFVTDGNKVYCEEIELLEYVLMLIQKYKVERLSNKIIYNVKFNIILNPNMQINSFFYNIISETNSKNIYVTSDKQVTIILTKKKIIIKMNNKIEDLALYLSHLILYYSLIENKNNIKKIFTSQKKIGIAYLSRICQNIENKIRKPFIHPNNEIDLNNYTHAKDLFYKNDNSEIYVDKDVIHKCDIKDNIGRKYIGFIDKFYIINNLCIPCCYLYTKEHDEIFNNCVSNKYEYINNIIDPYILTYNKVLTKNRLSFLYPALDKMFNKGSSSNSIIKLENNRISYAKNFYCISYYNNEIIDNRYSAYDIIKNNNAFIFLKNIILTPLMYRYTNDIDKTKEIKFFILIQNILHVIVKIDKEEDNDKIIITTNVSELYEYIKSYIKTITSSFKISNSGLEYNEKGFYIDGVKFTEKLSTNYISTISYKDSSNKSDQLNIYDNELLDNNIDIDNIELNNKENFILSFNANYLLLKK